MSKKIQSVKGMPDVLPFDTPLWWAFEVKWQKLVESYGYQEIRMPLLEETALFKRSIGEVTDIVEKEMFTLEDRDGISITLRPEGTAGCVRLALEHGLIYNQIQRLWYKGPMFRYEKPQKGRYRQFHHVGIETFGLEGPDIEAEHILMMHRFWKETGVNELIALQINSLGSDASRKAYRAQLVDYFSKYQNDLDEDSKRRLTTNPLRILDSKNASMAQMIQEAPKSHETLDAESRQHFEGLQERLTNGGVPFIVNPRLVRGLDYYNRTVYEWVTDRLGAQGTVCAGGRYDNLVAQLGGDPTLGVGFAMGVERFLLLWKENGFSIETTVDAYLISVGEIPEKQSLKIAEKIRDSYPKIRLITHCGGGNFKNQFKKADKSGAKIAFILGEQELEGASLGVKFLREDRPQESVKMTDLGLFLEQYFRGTM